MSCELCGKEIKRNVRHDSEGYEFHPKCFREAFAEELNTPFIASSELTGHYYIVLKKKKYDVTKQIKQIINRVIKSTVHSAAGNCSASTPAQQS